MIRNKTYNLNTFNNITVNFTVWFNTLIIIFLCCISDVFSQNMIISPGTTVSGINGTIVLNNSIINNGSFLNIADNVILAGSSETIGGINPVSFSNLTINAGSSVTLTTSGQTIDGILLCNGTLNSGGNLILLSKATGTSLIDGSGNGTVTGNVTIQRYLPSGFGYKYFSSPFLAATAGEFSDEINLSASFPPVYKYDENRNGSGWVTYSMASNLLSPLSGYSVNLGADTDPLIVDISGTVNNGDITTTLFNQNKPFTKGFNLAGNPYPSPIDWDIPSGWTRTNIDNAIYYFRTGSADQYSGYYSTYLNGVSSDGEATGIIPSMQGFFVHVSDGSWPVTGTLGVNNSSRINNMTHTFLKSASMAKPLIRFASGYSDDSTSFDPFVIYYDNMGTFNFDGQLDALKLFNTNGSMTNFYVFGNDGSRLSINALPFLADTLCTLRLGLKTGKNGNVVFKISEISDAYLNYTIYLSDNVSGVNQSLTSGQKYIVNLPAGDYQNRFFLNITTTATNIPPACRPDEYFKVYNSHGVLKADIILEPGNYGFIEIYNLTGQIIFKSAVNFTGNYELHPLLNSGIIIVSFKSKKGRISKKIYFSNE